MTAYKRTTFSQAREILEHSVDYLRQIRDRLDCARSQAPSDRVAMLLETFETEQRNLLGALQRYLEDAPKRALDAYSQYSVALPEALPGPEAPLSTLTLTQWLLRLNQHLIDMFAELGATAPSTEAREIFATLASQVESHDRRIAKEYQRFEDL
jgi:uncharacterized membrane protein YccC